MEEKKLYTCSWVFDTLVILCDGKVVCGCDDPYGKRFLGNIKEEKLEDIWNSRKIQKIRKELNDGYSSFCENCCIREEVDCREDIEQRDIIQPKVLTIFLEPTVICNLNCYKSICGAGGAVFSSRNSKKLSFEDFKMVIDQLGDGLERLNFYNYGELFVHPQAVDMVEYVKSRYPSVHVFTSTNLLMLDEEKIERLVKAGMDEITASVDGSDQESYSKYRCGGDFDKVVSIFETIVKKKRQFNSLVPYVSWKYLLFKWNSSNRHLKRAVEIAGKIGIDRLFWEATAWPPGAKSKKYQEGTRAWNKIKHESFLGGFACNAIEGKKYLADIDIPYSKKRIAAGINSTIKVTVKNKSMVPWSEINKGFADRIGIGGRLYDNDKKVIDDDYTLAPIDIAPAPGSSVEVDIILPAIEKVGRYYLKLDVTASGIGWLEQGGSKIRWVKMIVSDKKLSSIESISSYSSEIELPYETYEIGAGMESEIEVSVKNRGKSVWNNISDTTTGWMRLGAQLYDEEKNILDPEYSRSFLKRVIQSEENEIIGVTLKAVKDPGTYYLKFDMVIEGIGRFEGYGSPVAWMQLKVK